MTSVAIASELLAVLCAICSGSVRISPTAPDLKTTPRTPSAVLGGVCLWNGCLASRAHSPTGGCHSLRNWVASMPPSCFDVARIGDPLPTSNPDAVLGVGP